MIRLFQSRFAPIPRDPTDPVPFVNHSAIQHNKRLEYERQREIRMVEREKKRLEEKRLEEEKEREEIREERRRREFKAHPVPDYIYRPVRRDNSSFSIEGSPLGGGAMVLHSHQNPPSQMSSSPSYPGNALVESFNNQSRHDEEFHPGR